MNIETQIRTYIAEHILFSSDGFPHDNDASFLDEGVIDSMGVMELVAFVKSSFQVEVEARDVTPQNFDSVTRLAAYVRGKQAVAA